MEPGDTSSTTSPSPGGRASTAGTPVSSQSSAAASAYFDAASLLGGAAAFGASPYGHLAHLPSAFSMMGHHPGFAPAPYGGLGSLADSLASSPLGGGSTEGLGRSAGSSHDPSRSHDSSPSSSHASTSNISGTTGGAEWWRLTSEHARRAAGTDLFGGGALSGGAPFSPPLPAAPSKTSSLLDALYQHEAKSLNGGLYPGMFQLPNLSTGSAAMTTTTTSSVSSSSSSKSSNAGTASPHSPVKTPSVQNDEEEEGSSRTRGKPESTRPKESTKTVAMETPGLDMLGLPSSLFSFPMGAAAGMGGLFAPPMFPYPFASAYPGAPMFPPSMFPAGYQTHPPPSPTMSHSPTPSKSSTHSNATSHSRRTPPLSPYSTASATVTTTTTTTSDKHSKSSATPQSSASTPSSRKKLFESSNDTTNSTPALVSSLITPVSSPSLSSNKQPPPRSDLPPIPKLKKATDSPMPESAQHKHKRPDDSSELSDVSSGGMSDDSMGDVSDSDDEGSRRHHRDGMPRLKPVNMSLIKPEEKKNTSTEKRAPASSSSSSSNKRPHSPEAVQDLSIKKKATDHKASSSSSTSSSPLPSSSMATSSAALSAAEAVQNLSLAYSMANSQQQMAELYAAAQGMPGKMPPHMFLHPAATAMMFPPGMLDGAAASLLYGPPPPSSASANRGRGGRARGGGRGSRGGGRGSSSAVSQGSNGSSTSVTPNRGGRRGGGRGRGRTAMFASKMLQLGEEEAKRRQQEQLQEQLRQQLTAQLKQQAMQLKYRNNKNASDNSAEHSTADTDGKKSTSQMSDLKPAATESDEEAEKKRAIDHFRTSRMGINKLRMQGSKLAQALMGQNVLSDPAIIAAATAKDKSDSNDAHSVSETQSKADSENSSESSESESSSEDSGESETESDEGQSSQTSDGTATPGKQQGSSDAEAVRSKRKRRQLDVTEIRIPLEHGWRRQTIIRAVGQRGLIGQVHYFTPCGKKLKTCPDVMRYLQKNGITDLVRENFTFSMNIQVGDFMEAAGPDSSDGYVTLSEAEVNDRFLAIQQQKKAKFIAKQERVQRRLERRQQVEEMARRMAEAKMQKKLEQQETAKWVAELKMRRKVERQQARESARREKQMRAMEQKQMKERERIMRHQEKIQRQEQLRIEREMRTQQIIENKRRKKEQMEQVRLMDTYNKLKEKEAKRQQAIMLKEQYDVRVALERERRRQHMLLVKALEARKKQEEREKMKEERRIEKDRERERKLVMLQEQRRVEIEVAREVRKPLEDMMLKGQKDMPAYERVKGVCLPGAALADCMMVIEFLHNFRDVLDFDNDSIPNMRTLQGALLNEEDYADEYYTLVMQLLRVALNDPGWPNPREAVTMGGEKIMDMDLMESNITEILRIFMIARNGKEEQLSSMLTTKSILCLTATDKSAVLAWLCNEILGGKLVSSEVDGQLENITNLKKDKFAIECKLRKLRMVQAKRFLKTSAVKQEDTTSSVGGTKQGSDDEDEDRESGNESEIASTTGKDSDAEEEEGLTAEELEKKIERLQKQFDNYRNKVSKAYNKLRTEEFGQDRYKRRYWALPNCGGVYVEGMESAEIEPAGWETSETLESMETESAAGVKAEVKADATTEVKTESDVKDVKVKTEAQPSDETPSVEHSTEQKNGSLETEVKDEAMTDEQKNGGLKTHEKNGYESDLKKTETNVKSENDTEEKVTEENKSSVVNGGIGLVANGSEPVNSPVKKEGRADVQRSLWDRIDEHIKKEPLVNGCHSDEAMTPIAGTKSNSHSPSPVATPEPDSFTPQADSERFLELLHGKQRVPSSKTESQTPPPQPLTVFNNSVTANSCKSFTSSPNKSNPSPFRSIESMIAPDVKPSSDSPSSSPFLSSSFYIPGMTGSSTPVSAENMLKQISNQYQSSWFSLLPKTPCDTRSRTHTKSTNVQLNDLSKLSSSSPRPLTPGHLSSGHGNLSYLSYSMDMSQSSFADSSMSSMDLSHLHGSGFDSFLKPAMPQSRSDTPTTGLISSMSNMSNLVPPNYQGTSQAIIENLQYEKPQPIPLKIQRGWWRITKAEQLKDVLKCLHTRGIRERELQRRLEKNMDLACQSCSRGSKDVMKLEDNDLWKAISASPTGVAAPDEAGQWMHDIHAQVLQGALDEVEAMEERVYSASLQVKGWRHLPKPSEDEEKMSSTKNPIASACDRLLMLESNIERRYLKPPLGKGANVNLANISGSAHQSGRSSPTSNENQDEDDDDDASPALLRWRAAVARATSAAQLSICIHHLNSCIAWEKSIMRVSCQICSKDDNEAQLLLCDSCDKGYHTYCFKPKLDTIPDGDWYCYECISKATGEACCVKCGKSTGKMVECDRCPRNMHLDCIEPALPRMPRRWSCNMCALNLGKGRRPKKLKTKSTSEDSEKMETEPEPTVSTESKAPPTPEKKPTPAPPEKKATPTVEKKSQSTSEKKSEGKKTQKSKGKAGSSPAVAKSTPVVENSSNSNDASATTSNDTAPPPGSEARSKDEDDLTPARMMLLELEKHEQAWPFLVPVKTKQFPSYRRIIKKPMDFQTIRNRLRDDLYKSCDDFAADTRLIFDNCQTFNEDDSEVGRAGHLMRQFFELRWKALVESS